jgi:hypothetical protein
LAVSSWYGNLENLFSLKLLLLCLPSPSVQMQYSSQSGCIGSLWLGGRDNIPHVAFIHLPFSLSYLINIDDLSRGFSLLLRN